jgi:hypothetical protein
VTISRGGVSGGVNSSLEKKKKVTKGKKSKATKKNKKVSKK